MFKCSVHSWESSSTPCIACFPVSSLVFEEYAKNVSEIEKYKKQVKDTLDESAKYYEEHIHRLEQQSVFSKAEQGITPEIEKKVSDGFDTIDFLHALVNQKDKEIQDLKFQVNALIGISKVQQSVYNLKNNL